MFAWIAVAVALYLFGILVGVTGFRTWVRQCGSFDWGEFALFAFMVILWPILLVFAIAAIIAFVLVYGFVFKVVQFMFCLGDDLGECFGECCDVAKGQKSAGKEQVK